MSAAIDDPDIPNSALVAPSAASSVPDDPDIPSSALIVPDDKAKTDKADKTDKPKVIPIPISYAGMMGGIAENALSGITGSVGSFADAVTGSDPGTHDWAYQPRTTMGKAIQATTSKIGGTVGNAVNNTVIAPVTRAMGGDPEAMRQTLAERVPEAMGAVGTVAGIGSLARMGFSPKAAVPNAPSSAATPASAVPASAAGAVPAVGSVAAPIAVDTAPIEGGVPPEMGTQRAQILQKVGIENARNSALTGDAKTAATDFQLSKLDEPVGVAAKAQFDAERAALIKHGTDIVNETGGTLGTDEDTLSNRGQTMAKPFDLLRAHIDDTASNLYDEGTKRLGAAPITTPNLESALSDRTLKNELLADGKSSFLDGVKDQLDNLKEINGGQLNVQNAEQFRQFLNGRWSTAKYAVGKLKGALDSDVGSAVGEDVYKPARQTIEMGHQLLDNPNGISKLFDTDPVNPLNRSTDFEKIPNTLARLSASQFDNVIRTLDTMPESIQPEAQAAKAEIKAHLANKVLDAGSSTQGQWNAPAVSKIIKANSAKLQSAFADQPDTLAKIQNLDSAGKILKVDQNYPGAAAQAANLVRRGGISNIIGKGAGVAGSSIGGTAGAMLAGPPGAMAGSTVGASLGAGIGAKYAQGAAEAAALKKWQSGMSQLSDIVPKSTP